MLEIEKAFKSPMVLKLSSAAEILEKMRQVAMDFGTVRVDDMYDLFEYETPAELAGKHMYWTTHDLAQVEIQMDNDTEEYRLLLPQPRVESNDYNPVAAPVDMVAHPPHYQSATGLEAIDVIKAFTHDLKGIQATDTGNIIKYICRWKSKNGLQDLKKAQWYLNHLIKEVEEENKNGQNSNNQSIW